MKKLKIILLLALTTNLGAQIRMDIDFWNKNDDEVQTINISIVNTTSNTYVLPIDTVGFKSYFSENKCRDFLMIRNYPDLGIIPMLKSDHFLEALIGDRGTLIPENNFFQEKDKIYVKERKKIIDRWRKTLELRINNDKWIFKNYYLFNNLVILKPNQKISFRKVLDFRKINYSSDIYYYYYYPVVKGSDYDFFLSICVDESLYMFLTEKQKKDFKNFIFFSGKIDSNILKLKM